MKGVQVDTAEQAPDPKVERRKENRRQTTTARAYLKALQAHNASKRRGPAKSVEEQLEEVLARLDTEDDPLNRVMLTQKRNDLVHAKEKKDSGPDLEDLQQRFVEIAKPYSERKGLAYEAWREQGVPAPVLRAAGMSRTRRS